MGNPAPFYTAHARKKALYHSIYNTFHNYILTPTPSMALFATIYTLLVIIYYKSVYIVANKYIYIEYILS